MSQLQRQQYKCAGCRAEDITFNLLEPTPSGLLLCQICKNILFEAKNDPLYLRRLMATLDYKKDKHNVYLIGSLRNPAIIPLGNILRQHPEFDVHDEWITPGPDADTNWQLYENARGRKWADALKSRGCQNLYTFDRAYMDLADSIVLTLPAGKSGMCELGYAAGIGKNTILFLNNSEPDRFEVMPNFATHIVKTEDELIQVLKGQKCQ